MEVDLVGDALPGRALVIALGEILILLALLTATEQAIEKTRADPPRIHTREPGRRFRPARRWRRSGNLLVAGRVLRPPDAI